MSNLFFYNFYDTQKKETSPNQILKLGEWKLLWTTAHNILQCVII